MDLISYETIRNAHRVEREEELQRLPEDFFGAVKKWLSLKEKQKDTTSLLEVENAKKLLEDIINRRQRKIVLSALRTIRGELPPSNLTDMERKFFDEFVKTLKTFRDEMKESFKEYEEIVEEKVEEAKESIKELKKENVEPMPKLDGKIMIKILNDLPRFVGDDMQAYGPLRKGDVITLPENIGGLLIRRRVAENLLE